MMEGRSELKGCNRTLVRVVDDESRGGGVNENPTLEFCPLDG
jgi:hypothetical protein